MEVQRKTRRSKSAARSESATHSIGSVAQRRVSTGRHVQIHLWLRPEDAAFLASYSSTRGYSRSCCLGIIIRNLRRQEETREEDSRADSRPTRPLFVARR